MAWKYENHPAGFYVSVSPWNFEIIHLTGTKKGIKYNRIMVQGGTTKVSTTGNGFYTLLWNCVDLDDPNFPHVYCATTNDVQLQFAPDKTIIAMITSWK